LFLWFGKKRIGISGKKKKKTEHVTSVLEGLGFQAVGVSSLAWALTELTAKAAATSAATETTAQEVARDISKPKISALQPKQKKPNQ